MEEMIDVFLKCSILFYGILVSCHHTDENGYIKN